MMIFVYILAWVGVIAILITVFRAVFGGESMCAAAHRDHGHFCNENCR